MTSEQAEELLPMWQVYQSISSSSTAAQAEVNGLIEQIQETMSAGQMQAITEMNLSQQDVFAAIQVQNITASSGSGQSSNSGVSFGPPDGGVPSGGPPVSACRGNAEVIPTEGASISDVYTAVAMRITAQANAFTPTALALPTTTPTIWPSSTAMLSATPTMQNASYHYSTANGCYNAAYVSDVTIPDGTVLAPSEIFNKTWKFQNTGRCDWDEDFILAFETGKDMDGENTTIGEAVAAGETDSLSVALVAPETEGAYTGYWRLSIASGDAFGQSVYVLLVVSEDVATITPMPTVRSTFTPTPTAEIQSVTATPTFTPTPSYTPTDTLLPSTEEPFGSTDQETSTPEAGT